VNEIAASIETQSYAANTASSASSTSSTSADSDTGKTVFGEKAQKKDGLGIFAKILDGLVSGPKNGAAVGKSGKAVGKINADSDRADLIEGAQDGKNAKGASRGKKAFSTGLPGDEALESALAAGEAAALLNNEGLDGALPTVAARESPDDAFGTAAERRSPWDLQPVELSLNRLSTGGAAAAEADVSDLTVKEVAEFLDMLKDAQLDARENDEKTGRKGAVDLRRASARDLESDLYRFSGAPRPGLVDVLAEGRADNKTSEARSKRGRDRPVIEVRDFRTGEARGADALDGAKTPALFQSERIDADIPVELGSGSSRENSVTEAGARQDFGESLARELRDHLNTDIVKQAQFILRDGGEGVIRLSLKPESLGTVKVRLEMTENKITGHIVVESSEAFKAFERELPVLEKAFQDSGFGETSLDMSFSQDSSSFAGNFGSGQDGDFPRFSPVFAASSYDAEAERQGALSEETVSGIASRSAANPSGRAAINLLV
jgi:hypothetical protein